MKIFIHKDPIQGFSLKEITDADKIFTCNWSLEPQNYGVPGELVTKIYNNHNDLSSSFTGIDVNNITVAYLPVQETDEMLINTLNIISLFNCIRFARLTIYCEEHQYKILSNYASDQISFNLYSVNQPALPNIDASIIITFGSGAIHFLKQKIPVIIVGPYGIGGWVNSVNLPYFLKSGFSGRPGGALREISPLQILIDEIQCIVNCKDVDAEILEVYEKVQKLDILSLSQIEEFVLPFKQLFKQFYDPRIREMLRPNLSSNITFEQKDNRIYVRRKIINDIICSVDVNDAVLFTSIYEKRTFAEVRELIRSDEDNFWDTIYSLYEKRIVLI